MPPPLPRIVIDTNVLVAALRSRLGGSHLLLQLGTGRFDIVLTVPLFLEYEEVLRRADTSLPVSPADVDVLLAYLAAVAVPQPVFYLWRPVRGIRMTIS